MTGNDDGQAKGGNRGTGLQPFHAMEILARAKALEAEGRSICHMEVGEPAAPPAPRVLEAVARALPDAQRYTHAKGLIELRRGLARYYSELHGVSVDPERMIVTMGSSTGFILAFLSAVPQGAKVAVTRPGYPAYLNILNGMGFGAVEIPLRAEAGWHLAAADIERAHAAEPFDGLLFASPANPTGASVTREELQAIVAMCRRLGVVLISDEIYHGLDYRGRSVSALEISDEPIIVNSFSKYHCMTGWRVGWMVLPERWLRRAEILQQNMFISAPTLSQVAALAALGERDYAEERKAGYAANRDLLARGLSELGFEALRQPDGAFYAYVDVTRFTNDSMTFCRELLEGEGVAITPGLDFDRVNGNRFVRFSYAGAEATVGEALVRLKRFLGR